MWVRITYKLKTTRKGFLLRKGDISWVPAIKVERIYGKGMPTY